MVSLPELGGSTAAGPDEEVCATPLPVDDRTRKGGLPEATPVATPLLAAILADACATPAAWHGAGGADGEASVEELSLRMSNASLIASTCDDLGEAGANAASASPRGGAASSAAAASVVGSQASGEPSPARAGLQRPPRGRRPASAASVESSLAGQQGDKPRVPPLARRPGMAPDRPGSARSSARGGSSSCSRASGGGGGPRAGGGVAAARGGQAETEGEEGRRGPMAYVARAQAYLSRWRRERQEEKQQGAKGGGRASVGRPLPGGGTPIARNGGHKPASPDLTLEVRGIGAARAQHKN